MYEKILIAAFTILFLLLFCNKALSADSLTGYLVDCDSVKSYRSAKNASELVANYNRQNALSESSKATGYVLYSDGKWFALDKHGSELAGDVIRHSIKKKGFYVLVSGKLTDETIAVDSLTELMDVPLRPH
jgi:hypothetical protein